MENNIPLPPDAHLSSGELGTENQYSVDVDADLRLSDEARKMLFQAMIDNARRATVDMYPENVDRIAEGRHPFDQAVYKLAEPLSVVDEAGESILADTVYILAMEKNIYEAFVVRFDHDELNPDVNAWNSRRTPEFLTIVLNKTPGDGLEMRSTGVVRGYNYKGRAPVDLEGSEPLGDGQLLVLADAMAALAGLQGYSHTRDGDYTFLINNTRPIDDEQVFASLLARKSANRGLY